MPRDGPVWLEVAYAQYLDRSDDVRARIDDRLEQLLENPRGRLGSYDAATDQWTTVFGNGTGLIVYAVVHERERIIVLRLI